MRIDIKSVKVFFLLFYIFVIANDETNFAILTRLPKKEKRNVTARSDDFWRSWTN
jgi:uncharacterized membrane protein